MNTNRRFWIAFGDIHQRISAVARIEDLDKAAGVLLNGDLTNIGSRMDAEKILDEVRRRNPRIYAQIGNMDTDAERLLAEQEVNVHARVTDLSGRWPWLRWVGPHPRRSTRLRRQAKNKSVNGCTACSRSPSHFTRLFSWYTRRPRARRWTSFPAAMWAVPACAAD